MKKILIVLVLVLFVAVFAVKFAHSEESTKIDPPASLKDGQITVHLKNGSTSTLSTNDFMVVPRKRAVKKLATKPVCTPTPMAAPPVAQKEAPMKKFRVSVYGGYGPNGFGHATSGATTTVDKSYSPMFGAGGAYKFYKDLSIQAIWLSNKSELGSLGLDF